MAHNNRPMRRSALIGPWGVGAIVPFPNDESLMIAGLDMWRYNDATPFVRFLYKGIIINHNKNRANLH